MPFKQNVVQASDVASLAFVFHASYLEHVWVNCTGMELVYFTCYSLENNNSLSLLPTDLQVPLMPLGVGESYPSRMWHSLMHVKDKVGSLLNVRTQLQSCQRSAPVFLSLDSLTSYVSISIQLLVQFHFISLKQSRISFVIYHWSPKQQ